jgi:hypothetical protein
LRAQGYSSGAAVTSPSALAEAIFTAAVNIELTALTFLPLIRTGEWEAGGDRDHQTN